MPFNPEAHKRQTWNHVRWMATIEPEYALWAAGWYERTEPHLFKDLPQHLAKWIAENQPEE